MVGFRGPVQLEIAFAAQVRGRVRVIGRQRLRDHKRGLHLALGLAAPAGDDPGLDVVVPFGVLRDQSEHVCRRRHRAAHDRHPVFDKPAPWSALHPTGPESKGHTGRSARWTLPIRHPPHSAA